QEYSKKQEEYLIFALAALFFFLFELLLRYTILKNIP
ncbi:MAG: aerotolerance regulator BatA, partial [Candidatus Symbiothrix sp.]|nr:aerotolerance regulator BatA [Candidatus Symbiothrix sp.]